MILTEAYIFRAVTNIDPLMLILARHRLAKRAAVHIAFINFLHACRACRDFDKIKFQMSSIYLV